MDRQVRNAARSVRMSDACAVAWFGPDFAGNPQSASFVGLAVTLAEARETKRALWGSKRVR